MAASDETNGRLAAFLKSGIYKLDEAGAFFIDPVRLLNRSYTRFRVSPSTYYSRFFPPSNSPTSENPRKRKRRGKEAKKYLELNSREQLADRRHQVIKQAGKRDTIYVYQWLSFSFLNDCFVVFVSVVGGESVFVEGA